MTVTLFGARYADSAPVMALLSLGYFIPSALGFNGATLKIYRRIGFSLGIDLGAALFNVGLSLCLIPIWGAVAVFGWLASKGPIGHAVATRILGDQGEGGAHEETLAELDDLRARVAELEERQDFSERLLAQKGEPTRLGGTGE